MKYMLKSFRPGSVARLQGVLMGLLSALMAVPIGMGVSATGNQLAGLGLMIAIPFFYFIGGYVSGWILAFVYNGLAGRLGGIEVELEKM